MSINKNIFLVLFALFLGTNGFGQKVLLDKIVGRVGDEFVLMSDVEDELAVIAQRSGSLEPGTKCYVLDNTLMTKLLLNQARLDSVIVKDEEVDAQLDQRIEYILGQMNNDVSQFEEFYGESISQVKDNFRSGLESQMLVDRIRREILAEVKVTPKEVFAFYESIPADSLPYFNSEVEIAEIVRKPLVNKIERQKALDKILALRKEIVDGGTFEDVASKNSEDFGSARIGGDLGWQKRGTFVAEFEAAAYNLEIDEMSEPIETEFGFHVIQLLERRGNRIHARHILIKPKITDQDLDDAKMYLDSVKINIIKDTLTFTKAVKKYSDKKVQSYTNGGRLLNPQTGTTYFEIAELDPDVYFAIEPLKVGEITAPVEFEERGEKLYKIFYLTSRSEPHKASLVQDYDKIKAATLDSKKTMHLNTWLISKLQETYISIDEDYIGECENLKKWEAAKM